jgi:hypothetical protein
MFRTFPRHLKQFCTALMLLLLAVVAAECFLQLRRHPVTVTVTPQASDSLQSLLVPSAVVHHEMLRLHTDDSAADVTIITNRLGLRSPELVQPRQQGVIRILVLGDETILGPELPQSQTVTARLEEFLSKTTGLTIEVVNAGIPGYCPLLAWLKFEHELQHLQPHLIVLHFDMTDVADDAFYRRSLRQTGDHQICPHSLLTSDHGGGHPIQRFIRTSALSQLIQSELGLATTGTTGASRFALHQRYQWTMSTQADLRLQIQHAMQPVQRFAQAAASLDMRLLITTSPTPWQVASASDFPALANALGTSMTWPKTEDLPYQILEAVCERSAVSLCSSVEAFRSFSEPARLFASDSVQLSPYGAALYARQIAAALLQDPRFTGLFPQPSDVSSRTPRQN